MESLGTINTMWAFLALLLYFTVEGIKWIAKNKEARKSKFATIQVFKDLSEKLDTHIKDDTKIQTEISEKLQGVQVLLLMQRYPYNSSNARSEIVRSAARKYFDAGHNGEVALAYHEWEERREEMLNNLKNQKQ